MRTSQQVRSKTEPLVCATLRHGITDELFCCIRLVFMDPRREHPSPPSALLSGLVDNVNTQQKKKLLSITTLQSHNTACRLYVSLSTNSFWSTIVGVGIAAHYNKLQGWTLPIPSWAFLKAEHLVIVPCVCLLYILCCLACTLTRPIYAVKQCKKHTRSYFVLKGDGPDLFYPLYI